MTLVLAPLRGQPGELIDIPTIGQSSQLCLSVDSTTLPITVDTSGVTNVSTVPGGTATAALDNLQASIAAATAAVLAVIAGLTTTNIANASGVTGASATAALDNLQEQIVNTASGTGYIQRLGFVPVGSTRIGTSFAGVVLQAATTWTTPAQVPPGNQFTWDIWPGGSGACGGKAGSTGSAAGPHGAPASGGAHKRIVLSRADILADLPFPIAPGALGLGSVGATRLGNLGGGTTLPATGGATGTLTSIGTLARVFPGAGGFLDPLTSPTNKNGNSGGGTMSAGLQSSAATALAGGNPGAPAAGATGEGGAGSPARVNAAPGLTAENGGASCGSDATGSTTPGAGGTSLYGCSAGGWGGQWSTGAAAATGANGGGPTPAVGGAAATGSGSGALVAGNGGNGANGNITRGGSAGAGGGGCRLFSTASPASARGGDGGDGGFPGGSGGGGGDASFGTFAGLVTDVIRGGDGGDGADGLALVTIT